MRLAPPQICRLAILAIALSAAVPAARALAQSAAPSNQCGCKTEAAPVGQSATAPARESSPAATAPHVSGSGPAGPFNGPEGPKGRRDELI